jgi:glycosyltransferase involved in cell wall biosynthesis
MENKIVTNPRVSVVMLAYNVERFLSEAIESVLQQTYPHFELIVVDDGSTDATLSIAQTYRTKDERVIVVKNEQNSGVVLSRNRAAAIATGTYLAVLDGDDVMSPDRLEAQVSFMETHVGVGMVASWLYLIDETGQQIGSWQNDLPSNVARATLLFKNCFAHSSVLFRREVLPEPMYQSAFLLAEDYDLYTRIDPTYQLVTLRAFLVSHRKRTGSLTDERRIELGGFIDQIYRNQLRALSIVPTDEELMVHRARHQGEASGVTDFLMKKERWLTKLVEANNQYKSYVPSAFDRVVGEKWFEACNLSTDQGLVTWEQYMGSSLSPRYIPNPLQLGKFLLKCIIRQWKR